MPRSLWEYRGFILATVKREFQSNVNNSILGLCWIVINPLVMVFVYTVVFSHVMRAKLPHTESDFAYSIYICSGIFAWNMFSLIIVKAQRMFVDNANMIKKIKFPRICLSAITLMNAIINFIIVFSLFTLFLVATKNFPGLLYLNIFPLIGILIIMAIGIGVIAGVLNVFFKDTEKIIEIILQFWFWLTPIIYPISIIPNELRFVIELNPLTSIIQGLQSIFVKKILPDLSTFLLPIIFSILCCICGISLYRRFAGELVDEL